MSESNETRTRRSLFLSLGAAVAGIVALATAHGVKRKELLDASREKARALAGRLTMPRDFKSLIQSYATNPKKVERFRELARWRVARDNQNRTRS